MTWRAPMALLLAAVAACGGVAESSPSLPDGGLGGHADAARSTDAASDWPAFDAAQGVLPPPDAAPPPFCTPGEYYVEVNGSLLDSTCPYPDGGAVGPTATISCHGEDLIGCAVVFACGGGSSIEITSAQLWPDIPPGSWSATARYVTDAGAATSYGTLTVDNWPSSGGTVGGTYAGGALSGKFCVRLH